MAVFLNKAIDNKTVSKVDLLNNCLRQGWKSVGLGSISLSVPALWEA